MDEDALTEAITIWIKNENEATRRLYDAELMDAPVAFSESGTAQVSEAVGEALVAHYDSIRPYEAETDES